MRHIKTLYSILSTCFVILLSVLSRSLRYSVIIIQIFHNYKSIKNQSVAAASMLHRCETQRPRSSSQGFLPGWPRNPLGSSFLSPQIVVARSVFLLPIESRYGCFNSDRQGRFLRCSFRFLWLLWMKKLIEICMCAFMFEFDHRVLYTPRTI